MKSAWFIIKLYQTGNIGPHNIEKMDGQNKDGYEDEQKAEDAMIELCKGKTYLSLYKFTVLKLWWN